MDEQSMIRKFQVHNSAEAFEAIYDTYIDMVFSRCLYILGEQSLAEEAAQDTMVKVYFGLTKFEGRSSLKTWIYRIATNHCFGILKKRKELSYEELKEEGVQFSDDNDLYKTLEDRSQVTDLLSQLPKDMRGLLVLKYADGYSYEEISHISGLSESAVKMRIHRAKLELKALHDIGRV
jgi:RNA polymerase sigma-70 factor (ECF subfamily)